MIAGNLLVAIQYYLLNVKPIRVAVIVKKWTATTLHKKFASALIRRNLSLLILHRRILGYHP